MTLQDIFDAMSFGEFSQISLGGQESGVINEHNWKVLVPHINIGLTDLHKRFFIKEGMLEVKLIPKKITYVLHSNHAVSNRRSRHEKYILDTSEDPYKDDLLKIEKVISKGYELKLNDLGDRWAVNATANQIIKLPWELMENKVDIPDCWKTDRLRITYRANHPKIEIPLGYFNPSREEIELPDTYLNALILFVASRVFFPVGLQNEQRISNTYLKKYEAECMALIQQGVDINRMETHYKFHENGWV